MAKEKSPLPTKEVVWVKCATEGCNKLTNAKRKYCALCMVRRAKGRGRRSQEP